MWSTCEIVNTQINFTPNENLCKCKTRKSLTYVLNDKPSSNK